MRQKVYVIYFIFSIIPFTEKKKSVSYNYCLQMIEFDK
jgi:hypothetical protein